mgnify:CR=1 FL=1
MNEEALKVLQSYNWPGNIRELKRICEQLSLTSPLPIIRGQDVEALIRGQGTSLISNEAFSIYQETISLADNLNNYELTVLKNMLNKYADTERICEVLQISRSSFYQKIKQYNLQVKIGSAHV